MKIAFYIEKFLTVRGGGAERSLAELMNEMCHRGHDVTLVVREPEARINENPFYDLHSAVRVRNLSRRTKGKPEGPGTPTPRDRQRGLRGLFARIQGSVRKRLGATPLRDVLEDLSPDLVVTFLVSHFPFVCRAMGDLDIPLVLCHRNDPAAKVQEWAAKGSRRLDGLEDAHARAALVTVQMASYKLSLPPEVQGKTVVIPNACTAPADRSLRRPADRETVILSVGRLARVKNHALVVDAFARLAPRHPDWRVDIYGDGPERDALQARIDGAGLRGRVHLKGTVSEIDTVYRSASLFAFPSHYEGFSRALSEAMAHELPSVCLQHCTFCREMVTASGGGLLAEDDPESYAAALEELIRDTKLRSELGQNARNYIGTFTSEAVHDAWEAAFECARSEATSVIA